MAEARPGSHKTSTFVVMDFNQEFAWPPAPRKKSNHLSSALEQLLQESCRLVLVTRDHGRLQLSLEFDSALTCLERIGAFARQAVKTNQLSLPAHIGIATGEGSSDIRPEHHCAMKEAKWMVGLLSDPAIFVAETTARLARCLTLHPYGLEEYGDFYNVTLGETYRLFALTHPQLPEFPKVDDERPRHNIPWQSDFPIGRSDEVEDLIQIIDNKRAVSLIGGSGVGKSLVAKRIGHEMLDRLRDGVKYVDLAGAVDRQAVLARIFRSIGLPVQDIPRLSLDLLRKHFGARSHLVILDGCDTCADALPPIVEALLESRQVRLLTTSLQPLPSVEIDSYLIEDLTVPQKAQSIKELEVIDSSALLIDGMRRYRQGLAPDDSEIPVIIEICRLTNGNPLALQLIARRLRHESLAQILETLKTPSAKRGALNPAVSLTLTRLDARSRTAIEHAAMFVDPWSLEELSDMTDIPVQTLSPTLEGLVQLGIIDPILAGSDGPKHILLSHFREGARTNLQAEGRFEELRERHFLALYSRVSSSIREINGPHQKRHLDRLDVLRNEFEEALRYLIECRPDISDFDMAMRASWSYWYKRNRLRSVVSLATAAFEKCSPRKPVLRARMMMLQGIFLTKAGESVEALEILEQAKTVADTTADGMLRAQILNNLGLAYWADANPALSVACYEEAAAYGRSAKIEHLELTATTGASAAMIDLGRLRDAEVALKRVEHLSANSPDQFDQWNLAIGWAEFYCESEDSATALEYIDEAIHIAVQIGDLSMISRSLMWKSRILLDLRRTEDAARSLGQCLCLMASGEHNFNKVNSLRLIELEMRLTSLLQPAKLAELRIEGALQMPQV